MVLSPFFSGNIFYAFNTARLTRRRAPPERLQRSDAGAVRFLRRPHPRFLRPKQIKQIREAAGLAPRTETSAERAWQHYQEIADAITRQLAHINRAIERALKRSEKRVQAAEEALERIRERATIDSKGRRVYRTADRQRGFTDDGQELTREEVESIQCRPDARHGSNARRPENATGG
jgi:hypothetical protein